jgi:hypothetical protein
MVTVVMTVMIYFVTMMMMAVVLLAMTTVDGGINSSTRIVHCPVLAAHSGYLCSFVRTSLLCVDSGIGAHTTACTTPYPPTTCLLARNSTPWWYQRFSTTDTLIHELARPVHDRSAFLSK